MSFYHPAHLRLWLQIAFQPIMIARLSRLVVAPDDGRDRALILKDLNDIADGLEWDIVDDQLVCELSSTFGVDIACEGLALNKCALDKRAGFGVHLPLSGCERCIGLEIMDGCEGAVDAEDGKRGEILAECGTAIHIREEARRLDFLLWFPRRRYRRQRSIRMA
jgi:hypothetical protein